MPEGSRFLLARFFNPLAVLDLEPYGEGSKWFPRVPGVPSVSLSYISVIQMWINSLSTTDPEGSMSR